MGIQKVNPDGFWSNHKIGLILCGLGEAACVFIMIFGSSELLLLGVSSILYFGFLVFGMIACAVLPLHWALRHRRMRALSDHPEDEEAQKPF
jgi:hypothetical protein